MHEERRAQMDDSFRGMQEVQKAIEQGDGDDHGVTAMLDDVQRRALTSLSSLRGASKSHVFHL